MRPMICEVTRPVGPKSRSVGTCIYNRPIVTTIQVYTSLARVIPTIVWDHNVILFSIKANNSPVSFNDDRKFSHNLITFLNDFSIYIYIFNSVNWLLSVAVGWSVESLPSNPAARFRFPAGSGILISVQGLGVSPLCSVLCSLRRRP